jgi:hypothetical protein
MQNKMDTMPYPAHLQKVVPNFGHNNSRLSATEKLLILCSQRNLEENSLGQIENLINIGIDWQKLLECAFSNGVTALVYNTLRESGHYSTLTQPIRDKLRSAYLYIISKSFLRHDELIKLLQQFNERNILVAPLKGTFLAKKLYGDVYWRDLSSDSDLLIREEDRIKARSLLQELGYINISDSREEYLGNYVFKKAKALPVDLHWSITFRIGYSQERTAKLLADTRLAEEAGVSYFEFKEEELLLYLAAHLAASSVFRQLRYVCDINELLSKYKEAMDWDRLISKAEDFRLASSLYTALKLAKNFFNSEMPIVMFKRLKPGLIKRVFIDIFANKKVMLRQIFRRRLIDKLLSPIFFRFIEGEWRTVFFPPRQALVTKNYGLRIIKGGWQICSIFLKLEPRWVKEKKF